MKKDRKFFQANLRKDVEIKQHIASHFYDDVVKGINQNMCNFCEKTTKEIQENEK